MSEGPTVTAYRERLLPSLGIWAAAAGLALGCAAVTLPLGEQVALLTLAGMSGLLVVLLLLGSTSVEVDTQTLRAGRARIPLRLLGTVQVLDAEAMRRARGTELDARAYLCLRGWVPGGVRVELSDPADPTPYWLLSSRSPGALAEAVQAARPPA
jgi:hypothetical protein